MLKAKMALYGILRNSFCQVCALNKPWAFICEQRLSLSLFPDFFWAPPCIQQCWFGAGSCGQKVQHSVANGNLYEKINCGSLRPMESTQLCGLHDSLPLTSDQKHGIHYRWPACASLLIANPGTTTVTLLAPLTLTSHRACRQAEELAFPQKPWTPQCRWERSYTKVNALMIGTIGCAQKNSAWYFSFATHYQFGNSSEHWYAIFWISICILVFLSALAINLHLSLLTA